MISQKAFILAAGFGKRLRPHTADRPKPMVEVGGESLINRTIDHLKRANISDFAVNTHYLGEVLHDHLAKRTDVHVAIFYEEPILDTGGGIKAALSFFGGEDFFVLSGDGLWGDGPKGPALKRMVEFWDPDCMDILMLLQPVSKMQTTKGVGDYDIDADGRAVRSKEQIGAYMFTSIRINGSHIFTNTPDEPFSYLQLLDRAQEAGRLYGLVHDGLWHHISTPDDLSAVRDLYEEEGYERAS